MTNRSRVSLIMGIIRVEHSELFTLYTLASTNINQSAPKVVEMYLNIRSRISYTMDLKRTEHIELYVIELDNLL